MLLIKNSNSQPNSDKTEIRTYALKGGSSREAYSGSEFNRLSGELNQGITMEMSDLMSTENSQIESHTLCPVVRG